MSFPFDICGLCYNQRMEYSVLIIDDEVELAESTAEYFNLFDVPAACVFTGDDALAFLKENTAKLILLDINLGTASQSDSKITSGFELCKILRKTTDIPILFVSARSSDDDMVVALNIGGDDYITKPFSLNVLYAKVKAVLKRYSSDRPAAVGDEALVFGDISVDTSAGIVTKKGVEVDLTAVEYKLLVYLVNNRNKVVNKQDIFDKVWEDSFVSDGTLNVHIRHLREKLEEDPNEPMYIRTARGRGYIFKVEE